MRVAEWPLAAAVALAAVLGLAACGSDAQDNAGPTTVDTMPDVSTEPPGDAGENAAGDVTDTTTPVTSAQDLATTGTSSPFTATPVLPDQGSALPPGDEIDHGSTIVGAAIADLAERLDIDGDRIAVLAALAVTWPDSSFGCPEPGMQYLQRMSDGALVVLEVDGRQYQYHGGSTLVLCEHPAARFAVD